jgi:YHS domain-containing protein
MTFIVRMLRFVFWVVVLSWSVALLRRLVRRMGQVAQQSQTPMDVPADTQARKLVRDPVCGMHIAEVLALPMRQNGELLHFCSAGCREKYLSETQKMAANG